MKLRVGIDIVDLDRIKKASVNRRFLKRVYTDSEIRYCFKKKDPVPSLAGRFAAKEAVIKAVGSVRRRLVLSEIEIIKRPDGSVKAAGPGLSNLAVSVNLSHSRKAAVAVAIAQVSPR